MKNGGAAFPGISSHWLGEGYVNFSGMTLLDYFAAKAMEGMLSRDSYQGGWSPTLDPARDGVKRVARFAYEYAAAMLEAREKFNHSPSRES